MNSIPIASVTSLEGLAFNIQKENGTICSLIDAKNHQVYCGIFDTKFNLLNEYLADDIDNVLNVINKFSDVSFVGDGAVNYLDKHGNKSPLLATQIGIIGYYKFKNGIYENADTISPLYLRVSRSRKDETN